MHCERWPAEARAPGCRACGQNVCEVSANYKYIARSGRRGADLANVYRYEVMYAGELHKQASFAGVVIVARGCWPHDLALIPTPDHASADLFDIVPCRVEPDLIVRHVAARQRRRRAVANLRTTQPTRRCISERRHVSYQWASTMACPHTPRSLASVLNARVLAGRGAAADLVHAAHAHRDVPGEKHRDIEPGTERIIGERTCVLHQTRGEP